MSKEKKFQEEMKNVIINNYHEERKFNTDKPEYAHIFNLKSGNMPLWIIIK